MNLLELIIEYLGDIPGASVQPFGQDANCTALLVFTRAKCATPCIAVIKVKDSFVTVHRRDISQSMHSELDTEFDIANPTFFPDLRELVLKLLKRFDKATAKQAFDKATAKQAGKETER